MINLETVKTLRVLRLPGMARELESQLEVHSGTKACLLKTVSPFWWMQKACPAVRIQLNKGFPICRTIQ